MNGTELQKSKKYVLILALAVIGLLALAITIIALWPKSSSQSPSTTPKISRQEFIDNLSEHPLLTRDYGVVYSKENGQIYISVINPPYEENYQKALDWIKSQGIDPASLKIEVTK